MRTSHYNSLADPHFPLHFKAPICNRFAISSGNSTLVERP